MAFYFRRFIFLLHLLSVLISIVFAVPDLSIIRDYDKEAQKGLQSYSTIIEFNDKSIPGDASKMPDAKFINLAKVAYDQMVSIWQAAQLPSNLLPGSMIALESEGRIYFASSIRAANSIDFNILDREIHNSVGWFQAECLESMGPHRRGGRCAEPNVLRLYGDAQVPTDDDPPRYKSPPATNSSPRIAVWGRPSEDPPLQGKETYFLPCHDTNNRGWGCNRFQNWYHLKPCAKKAPDPNGQDDWQFSSILNPRGRCAPATRSRLFKL